ncbi:MAG: hypothetical protein U0K68_11930 [Agathobacter sp.]|nr:hypothetical protein [Agathobacter sp.]
MTPQQKKHQEEYDLAKRRYEKAYSQKKTCDRKVAELNSEKQTVIKQINNKAAKKKSVDAAATQMEKTNGKDSEINTIITISAKRLTEADSFFTKMGESSNGNVKSLENIFEEKNKTTDRNIKVAMKEISAAKKKFATESGNLKSEIAKLKTKSSNLDSDLRKYSGMSAQADADMRRASIDMAYHKSHMNDA